MYIIETWRECQINVYFIYETEINYGTMFLKNMENFKTHFFKGGRSYIWNNTSEKDEIKTKQIKQNSRHNKGLLTVNILIFFF